jgi:hypothetical protein
MKDRVVDRMVKDAKSKGQKLQKNQVPLRDDEIGPDKHRDNNRENNHRNSDPPLHIQRMQMGPMDD